MEEEVVLCAASAYEQKFYLNPQFESLPEAVRQELQIMCVLYTEDVGGILLVVYDEEGNIKFVGDPEAYRGLFLIDKSGVVRHQVVNDMPLGRSVEEILRVIDALQFTEEYGEVCPANWEEGKDAMHADRKSTAEYLGTH